ncbi:hypothetical protein B0H19DRAFT_1266965 [Mycena capillaripes]|nr:hypothetical protein B0H19DRAFT_1266965 [Mycena capillaripes]
MSIVARSTCYATAATSKSLPLPAIAFPPSAAPTHTMPTHTQGTMCIVDHTSRVDVGIPRRPHPLRHLLAPTAWHPLMDPRS